MAARIKEIIETTTSKCSPEVIVVSQIIRGLSYEQHNGLVTKPSVKLTYRRSVYQNDIYLFSPDLLDAGRLQKTHGMVVATVGFRM